MLLIDQLKTFVVGPEASSNVRRGSGEAQVEVNSREGSEVAPIASGRLQEVMAASGLALRFDLDAQGDMVAQGSVVPNGVVASSTTGNQYEFNGLVFDGQKQMIGAARDAAHMAHGTIPSPGSPAKKPTVEEGFEGLEKAAWDPTGWDAHDGDPVESQPVHSEGSHSNHPQDSEAFFASVGVAPPVALASQELSSPATVGEIEGIAPWDELKEAGIGPTSEGAKPVIVDIAENIARENELQSAQLGANIGQDPNSRAVREAAAREELRKIYGMAA